MKKNPCFGGGKAGMVVHNAAGENVKASAGKETRGKGL